MTEVPHLSFEAVKTSISQNKDGVILRLAIHPNDVPPELLRSWVGARYMCVLVQLDDEDKPTMTEEGMRVERAIASAGLLCRVPAFFFFLIEKGLIKPEHVDATEEEREKLCASTLRAFMGVQSRSEMRTNARALEEFEKIRSLFAKWQRDNPVPK